MKRSAWWFLLPIVLGIIGSAIAWSKLRDSEDPELLKWIMIFGAVQTVVIGMTRIGMPVGDEFAYNGQMMMAP